MKPLDEPMTCPGGFPPWRDGKSCLISRSMSKNKNHCKEIGMNNTMIRVLSLVLCLIMVLGLTACGGSQGTSPARETQSAQSTQNTQTS